MRADHRGLGPRQREWLEKIKETGGKVTVTRGYHGQVHFGIPRETIPARIAESLWDRGLLIAFWEGNRLDRLILRSEIETR